MYLVILFFDSNMRNIFVGVRGGIYEDVFCGFIYNVEIGDRWEGKIEGDELW